MKVLVVVHAQINSLTLVLAHSRPFKQTSQYLQYLRKKVLTLGLFFYFKEE